VTALTSWITKTNHVVVVDHDPEMRRIIDDLLEEDGFRVTSLADGEALLALLRQQRPDLVILELQLPGIRGTEILRRLQVSGRVPAIVVSTKGSEMDRIVGLEMGADDYLPKPFSLRELLARAHAVLRRTGHICPCDTLEYDGFRMDLTCRDVVVDGEPVELTSLEFDLLAFLAGSPRQVFSRDTLLDRVWGSSREWQTPATVSEHIHRLRRKIESDSSHPQRIQTMRGAGYRFVP
jgi:two-component system phosphate regulon response regulator PhoB